MKDLRLTTVTPVYSGEETISKLVKEIKEFQNYLIDINCPIMLSEAIFVDDESIDNSDDLLEKLSSEYDWIRVINLSKISGNKHVRKFNSFRLIRGNIARATAAVAINQTYFDVALTWFTNRIDTVKIPLEDSRYTKKRSSGYSLERLISHTKRLILSSDFKILRMGSLLGIFCCSYSRICCIIYRLFENILSVHSRNSWMGFYNDFNTIFGGHECTPSGISY
ncbi:MAG: glycosyltransferase [Balneolaceae bacterium]|nr:glycosyltransferase [Balneolaceae bacterium]